LKEAELREQIADLKAKQTCQEVTNNVIDLFSKNNTGFQSGTKTS
jgi:hypothetical protein